MKKVWQYKRIGGLELEVSEDFPIQTPFTDIHPIEEIELEQQFFIPSEKRWKEITNQLESDRLDNLESLYDALENENKICMEKINTIGELNAKTMIIVLHQDEEIRKLKEQSERKK